MATINTMMFQIILEIIFIILSFFFNKISIISSIFIDRYAYLSYYILVVDVSIVDRSINLGGFKWNSKILVIYCIDLEI